MIPKNNVKKYNFLLLFFPECGSEEEEDGEDFEAACEHDERQDPFAECRDDVVLSAVAGDGRVESGVGNAGECREKCVDERHSHRGEYDGSGGYYHAVEAEEDYDFRHEVRRHGPAVEADGVDIVGVDAAVYFVARVLSEHEDSVDFGAATCRSGTSAREHENECECEGECAPVAESGCDISGGCDGGYDHEEGFEGDGFNVRYLSVGYDRQCEEHIHHEDDLDVGAESVVLPHGAEVAVDGAEYEGEVDSAEKHEYRHYGEHIVAVPGHEGVVACGESAGAHDGE